MPLILPSQRLIRPSPLAYPAGAVPGIDRSHPAFGSSTASFVAANGGEVSSLTSGLRGSNQGAPTTSVKGLLGPVTNYDAASDLSQLPFVSLSGQNLTLAGILKITTTTGATQYIMQTSSGGADAISVAGGNFKGFIGPSSPAFDTGVPYILEVPYFYAISSNGAIVNWVVLRLDTGKLLSGVLTTIDTTIQSGNGNIQIGNLFSGASSYLAGGLAAAMASHALLSQQQLLQWAADPWSFWYPRPTIQYTTPATTTLGGARIRQRWNRSPLAYPAGAVAGIDPSHPASKGCLLSAAPRNVNFVNLITGAPLIGLTSGNVGALTTNIVSPVGPAVFAGPGTYPPGVNVTATVSAYTIGAIFGPYTPSGTYQALVYVNDANFGFWLKNGVPELGTNVDNVATTPALTTGHSYFIAASTSIASGSLVNFVVRDLVTGQVFTSSITQTNAGNLASITNIGIAQDKFNEPINSPYAAGMFSNTLLSMSQLQAWAQDPWAFWYPNNFKEFATAGITPPPPTIVPARTMMGVGV